MAAGGAFPTVLRTNDTFRLPQSSWMALLSIAHRYEFMNVWKRAIDEIYERGPFRCQYPNAQPANTDSDSDVVPDPDSRLDDAMLISAAEKYDVPLWHVVPTFVAFVMREESLTEAEAALMSLGTVIRLAHARESFLRKTTTTPAKPPSVTGHREAVAKSIARDLWPAPRIKLF